MLTIKSLWRDPKDYDMIVDQKTGWVEFSISSVQRGNE